MTDRRLRPESASPGAPGGGHAVDTGQALRGARALGAAGRHLAAQREQAGAEAAAASAARPWGRDDAGQAVERRYRDVERQVLDAWEQLAAYVENLGDTTARSIAAGLDES